MKTFSRVLELIITPNTDHKAEVRGRTPEARGGHVGWEGYRGWSGGEEEKPKLKGLKGSHDRSVGGFTVDSENEKVSRQASVGDAWVTGGGKVDGWAGEGG